MNEGKLKRDIRILLYLLIAGLVVSGITAFPIHTELALAHDWSDRFNLDHTFSEWIDRVYQGVNEIDQRYPFIPYGTDWLAFAHLVMAVLFAGILKDALRNIWVIQFGMVASVGIFPLALIAGTIRGIPFFWQLLDCSFGVVAGVVLWTCHSKVRKLTQEFSSGTVIARSPLIRNRRKSPTR